MSIHEFITTTGLTMTVAATDHNPAIIDRDQTTADHWAWTLHYGDRAMTGVYSKFIGRVGQPPSLAKVLDDVCFNAYAVEDTVSIEHWAREYEMNLDEPQARRSYEEGCEYVDGLMALLGAEKFQTLLYETDWQS